MITHLKIYHETVANIWRG